MFQEFVLWVVVGSLIICVLKLKELDTEIRKIKLELTILDKIKSDIKRVEQYQQDIANSLSDEEYNMLGLHRYVRDLEKVYYKMDNLMKECNTDIPLRNQLFHSREDIASKITKTSNEILQIRRKRERNE